MTTLMLGKPQKPRLVVQHDRVCTTSVAVAEFFGKRHDNVMRDIEALIADCEAPFRESKIGLAESESEISFLNFEERDYVDSVASDSVSAFMASNFQSGQYVDGRSKTWPMYLMTKDGFMLLAMGFTGRKALAWKIRYIEAFDAMAQTLGGRATGAVAVAGVLAVGSGRGVADLLPVCGGYRVPAQVLGVLLDHGADREPVALSFREIVRASGNQVSVTGVHNGIAHLQRAGYIELVGTGMKRSYWVLPGLFAALEQRRGSGVPRLVH
jgi:Rha family phage regulatory protein